jgi:prepilin-type N-terminal cleavage/methylation domain-containing protein
MLKLPKITRYYFQNSSAYTLIEILVVMTIIGILFGFGYSRFRDFSRRQVLVGTVRNVQGDIRTAQAMALEGQKPASGCTADLIGYTFTTSSNQYTITANCGTNITAKTVALTGITATSNSVQFKVLGKGTGTGSDVVFTFTQAATGSSASITVSPGGEIR